MRWVALVSVAAAAFGVACESSRSPGDTAPQSTDEGGKGAGGESSGAEPAAGVPGVAGFNSGERGGEAGAPPGAGGTVGLGNAGAAGAGDGGAGASEQAGAAGEGGNNGDVPAPNCGPQTCVPGESRCAGNGVQTCTGGLVWGNVVSCPDSAPVCHLGACAEAPSCAGLTTDCGSASADNCCASPTVAGGSFNRSNDPTYPATVSSFRLDKYEATVGRFRKFVAAAVGGWLPPAGAGKHAHLSCGVGLKDRAGPGYEPGWDEKWNASLPVDQWGWDHQLTCYPIPTWTQTAGANERRPINCVNWAMAAAFCIWDGGFLPSETEWNYAAAGGAEQRKYPWGNTEPGIDAKRAAWHCAFMGNGNYCLGVQNIAPVGSILAGKGRYGQLDLAGNVREWTLDWFSFLTTPCDDCAYTSALSNRTIRGGGYDTLDTAYWISSVPQEYSVPNSAEGGVRCARSP